MRTRPGPACAVALLLAAGQVAAEREQELSLRRAIEDSRRRVSEYESRERGLLEAVEALDRALTLLTRDVARARREADEAQRVLGELQAEAEGLQQRLAATQRAMARRAVALYKAGAAGSLQLLFSAEGLRELMARVQSLRWLLDHDAELLARHRAQSEALEHARRDAAAAAQRHETAARELRQRSQQLDRERSVKRRLAERLGSDRARERGALVELETAARAFDEALGGLRAGADEATAEGPAFESLRGRLPAPVDAPVRAGFGRVVDAQHRTEITRKGIEFAAPQGAPVVAIAAGRVRFADWFRGYGRSVVIDHGGGHFSVSAHLEEIAVQVGETVASGSRIGRVGESGSLAGPGLYFEIRRGAEPLDPAGWLRPLRRSR